MRLPWRKGAAQQLDLLSLDAPSQTTVPDEAATRLQPVEPKQSPGTKTATRGVPPRVPVTSIDEDPNNPRTEFPEAEIDKLAGDIRQHGILQPLVVHPADAQGRCRLTSAQGDCARRSEPA